MFKKSVSFQNYKSSKLAFTLFAREDDGAAEAAAAKAKAEAETLLQKKIDDAVAVQVSGLKAKNEELLGKVKEAQNKSAQYDGMDMPKLKEMMDRMDKDEDAKLFAEGKGNVVIDKYTRRMQDNFKSEIAQEKERTLGETKRADAYRSSVLDNQIRAVTSGLHKGAVEDALLHGRNMFTLDAKGNAVQLDSEGRAVIGKDGSTPFGPAEWIELQKELKPHWFPAGTSGSGAGGGRESGAGGGGKTMTRTAFAKLDSTQQSLTVRSGTQIVD